MPVALITGASRGLGRALALALARDHWSLVLDARRSRELNLVRDAVSGAGAPVFALAGDVSEPDHQAALIEAAHRFGALDLLVNNASTLGPTPLAKLENYPLEELRRVYEVNTVAPLALLQRALPLLRRAGGIVVTMSSDAAVEGYARWGGYGSSKAASDQLLRTIAVEETALRFYAFDPGDMRTDLHQAAFAGEDISDRPAPETVVAPLRELLDSGSPSGRYRVGERVAR